MTGRSRSYYNCVASPAAKLSKMLKEKPDAYSSDLARRFADRSLRHPELCARKFDNSSTQVDSAKQRHYRIVDYGQSGEFARGLGSRGARNFSGHNRRRKDLEVRYRKGRRVVSIPWRAGCERNGR